MAKTTDRMTVNGQDYMIEDSALKKASGQNGTDILAMNGIIQPQTQNNNGITFIVNSDNSISISGTATAEATLTLMNTNVSFSGFLKKGVKYLSEITANNPRISLQVIAYNGSSIIGTVLDTRDTGAFTIPSETTGLLIRISVPSGSVISSTTCRIGIYNNDSTSILSRQMNNLEMAMNNRGSRFPSEESKQSVQFSDLEIYREGSYMDASGNISRGPDHKIIRMPAAGISFVQIDMNEPSNADLIIVMGKNTIQTTLKQIGRQGSAPYKLCGIFPGGLAADAWFYINWYYANSATPARIADHMTVEYANEDKRIVSGRNKFNRTTAVESVSCYYEDGVVNADANYAMNGFPVEPGDIVRINATNPTAHVVFKNKYGGYISGVIGSANNKEFTAPTLASFCIISCLKEQTNFIATVNDDEMDYVAFSYRLIYSGSGSSGGFLPYFEGYRYKTFNTPQGPDFDGTTYTNTTYLKLPVSYNPEGEPTNFVIIVHGASAGISSDGTTGWTYSADYNKIVNALLSAGYAVMDSNGYNDDTSSGHDHWSCPQALVGYLKAYDYYTKHYNLNKLAFVYGFSMGGLTALNLADMIPMRCMMIGAPAVSIYNQCIERPETPNPNFLAAYGISEYDRENLYGCDRYLDIVDIDGTPMIFKDYPPLFIGYGDSDTNISNQHVIDYYEALYNSNHHVRIQEYTGGHEISFGANDDLITDMVNYFNSFKG